MSIITKTDCTMEGPPWGSPVHEYVSHVLPIVVLLLSITSLRVQLMPSLGNVVQNWLAVIFGLMALISLGF